jgi:nucleotidyltransferase substrate binding protein (TIGR01987 family)
LEKEGLIQRFEYTYELAWKVMKDYLEYQGITGITGSRDAIREAFQKELINDGENWMNMIKSRNQTIHLYNEATANEIATNIIDIYFELFKSFNSKMETQK